MWQGLHTITLKKYRYNSCEHQLCIRQQTFYTNIEVKRTNASHMASDSYNLQMEHSDVIATLEHNVCRVLQQVNIRKAPGPDGISWRLLYHCAVQLIEVFTFKFKFTFRFKFK